MIPEIFHAADEEHELTIRRHGPHHVIERRENRNRRNSRGEPGDLFAAVAAAFVWSRFGRGESVGRPAVGVSSIMGRYEHRRLRVQQRRLSTVVRCRSSRSRSEGGLRGWGHVRTSICRPLSPLPAGGGEKTERRRLRFIFVSPPTGGGWGWVCFLPHTHPAVLFRCRPLFRKASPMRRLPLVACCLLPPVALRNRSPLPTITPTSDSSGQAGAERRGQAVQVRRGV